MLKLGTAMFLGALVTTSASFAQEEADASHMSCNSAASLVSQRGAVLMGTGPNSFERIVRDQGFCSQAESTTPVWVHAADNPQCFAGYRCRDKFNEGSGRD